MKSIDAESMMGRVRAAEMSGDERDLIRRYLLWCYKTTKEELDRIDRKFTQLIVDRHILRILEKAGPGSDCYQRKIEDFKTYIADKEISALKEKFVDGLEGEECAEYRYLKNRLNAVKQAAVDLLGTQEAEALGRLYEEEMTQRILAAREH